MDHLFPVGFISAVDACSGPGKSNSGSRRDRHDHSANFPLSHLLYSYIRKPTKHKYAAACLKCALQEMAPEKIRLEQAQKIAEIPQRQNLQSSGKKYALTGPFTSKTLQVHWNGKNFNSTRIIHLSNRIILFVNAVKERQLLSAA